MKKIYKVEPIIEARVWGGQKLREFFGYKTDLPNIAEVYHVIAIPGHLDCPVTGTGQNLSKFYRKNRDLFGCKPDDLPVRLVTANAVDKMSYHLHPTDEYALAHEGMRGKHEGGLYFGGAKEAMVIMGHNAQSLEELKQWVKEGAWDKLLRMVPMKENQFSDTPIGTLHGEEGTGEEISVAWSTNGDVTYRLYDHGRNDPKRPLHVQQVYDNIKIPDNEGLPFDTEPYYKDGCQLYDYFEEKGEYTAVRLKSGEKASYERPQFWFALNIGADGTVGNVPCKRGETVLVPCGSGAVPLSSGMDLCVLSYTD